MAQCVLWHALDAEPSEVLLAALKRRDIAVNKVQNGYRALAHVCLGERAWRGARERSANGAGESSARVRQQAMILLVVQPELLAGLPATIDAVARYASHTVWWVYEPDAQPQLRGIGTEELRQRIAPPSVLIEPSVQAGQVTPQGIVWSSQTEDPASLPRMVGPDIGPRGKSPPALRLSGHGAPLVEPKLELHAQDEDPPTSTRNMLSEEELEMLLAEDFGLDEGGEELL